MCSKTHASRMSPGDHPECAGPEWREPSPARSAAFARPGKRSVRALLDKSQVVLVLGRNGEPVHGSGTHLADAAAGQVHALINELNFLRPAHLASALKDAPRRILIAGPGGLALDVARAEQAVHIEPPAASGVLELPLLTFTQARLLRVHLHGIMAWTDLIGPEVEQLPKAAQRHADVPLLLRRDGSDDFPGVAAAATPTLHPRSASQ